MIVQESFLPAARDLHRRCMVIDSHVDTTQRLLDPGWDFTRRHSDGHVDLPRLREGGISAAFLAVWKAGPLSPSEGAAAAREQIRRIHDLTTQHPEVLCLARSAEDIRKTHRAGQVAILIGIEGGYLIEDSLDLLREFHRAGAMYMTLTHGFHTTWADSSGIYEEVPPRHGGLTDFGRDVIGEMNRLGMMVDVSHVSDTTFWDVVKTSTAPIVATHSSCRAVAPQRRNLSDDMLRAIADSGGVAQMNLNPPFIDPAYPLPKSDADAHGPLPEHATPMTIFADHIDHAIRIAGAEHVGIGTDFDGIRSVPVGLDDCSRLPYLTAELLRRGHSEETLVKVLGGNLMRVMDACQKLTVEVGARID